MTVNGILAEGTITAADVIARPDSAACPGGVATLADVIAKIRSGGAYANVHTLANPSGRDPRPDQVKFAALPRSAAR